MLMIDRLLSVESTGEVPNWNCRAWLWVNLAPFRPVEIASEKSRSAAFGLKY